MPFTSPSFDDAKTMLASGGHNAIIPVGHLSGALPIVWRSAVLIRVFLLLTYPTTIAYWMLWLQWRMFAPLLGMCFPNSKLGDVLRGRRPGHEFILRFSLIILANYGSKTGWRAFWNLYFLFGDRDRFHQNYMEAFRQRFAEEQRLQIPNPQNPTFQPRPNASECSVIMFRDNGRPLLIPCRWNMTDQQFIRHIRNFYYLQRLEGGFLELFSFKTINFIEVVKLEQRLGVGFHQYYLNLARYGSGNRLVRFWFWPSQLSGTSIVEKLITDAVLAVPAPPTAQAQAVPTLFSILFASSQQLAAQVAAQNQALGDHQMALNVVNKWNTDTAGVVVAVPLLASLMAGVVWPVVAVAVFHADVNISVQTGFAIATYVITAGAILIALVTFLDTQNEKVKVS